LELEVAVKLLKKQIEDPKLDEFYNEIHIMSNLNHVNILHMHGVCMTPQLGIVIEYVRGSDLQHLLERCRRGILESDIPHNELPGVMLFSKGVDCVIVEKGDLPENHLMIEIQSMEFIVPSNVVRITSIPVDDALISWQFRVRVALDVARGMQYLHSLVPPIAHRDLRSPNVFILSRNANSSVVAKIGDLGLAVSSHNKLGRHLATWQWLAPEVINLTRAGYDIRSDIYSFGIVMYEIATRCCPFIDDCSDRFRRGKGFDRHAFMQAIVTEHLRPIVDPNAPPPFWCAAAWKHFCLLMQKCWDGSPGMNSIDHLDHNYFFITEF
jgi:serine/threonine protein kinase